MMKVTVGAEFEEEHTFEISNEDWANKLLDAIVHVKHPMRLKLAVIAGVDKEVFEAIGGTENIYYDIKGPIDSYCYSKLQEMEA